MPTQHAKWIWFVTKASAHLSWVVSMEHTHLGWKIWGAPSSAKPLTNTTKKNASPIKTVDQENLTASVKSVMTNRAVDKTKHAQQIWSAWKSTSAGQNNRRILRVPRERVMIEVVSYTRTRHDLAAAANAAQAAPIEEHLLDHLHGMSAHHRRPVCQNPDKSS